MCCFVPKALLPEGKGRDVYPRVKVNRRAVCVVCALCACVFLHSLTSAHLHLAGIALPTPVPCHTGSRRPTAPCVPRCTVNAFCAVPHCLLLCTSLHCTALCVPCCTAVVGRGLWAVGTASLPRRTGQCNPCNALPHCLEAVGTGTPAIHCLTA